MITTIHGDMDEAQLWRKDIHIEDARESTDVVEYYLKGEDGLPVGEPVHRSAHIGLKQPAVFGISAVGGVG